MSTISPVIEKLLCDELERESIDAELIAAAWQYAREDTVNEGFTDENQFAIWGLLGSEHDPSLTLENYSTPADEVGTTSWTDEDAAEIADHLDLPSGTSQDAPEFRDAVAGMVAEAIERAVTVTAQRIEELEAERKRYNSEIEEYVTEAIEHEAKSETLRADATYWITEGWRDEWAEADEDDRAACIDECVAEWISRRVSESLDNLDEPSWELLANEGADSALSETDSEFTSWQEAFDNGDFVNEIAARHLS